MTDDEDKIAVGTPKASRRPGSKAARAETGEEARTLVALGSGSPEPGFDPAGATLPVQGDRDSAPPAMASGVHLSPAADEPALLPSDPDRYVFGDEIARGGMGRIIAARDRRLGKAVAIKELLDASEPMRARFEREARITAKLQHPATISILEAGVWPDGKPFYVMDLVAGQSLDRAIAARTTAAERFGLIANVIAVVDTMAYAHNLQIIHRDLKPANVLCGEFGETVVIDWGLAKDLGNPSSGTEGSLDPRRGSAATATQAGLVLGTPAYMPPEQAEGEFVDERADVYALGAILYHVVAGQPPYIGRTAEAVLVEVTAGPPPPLAEVAPHAPPELVTIVHKAMARDPEARYRSAKELAADLKRFQTGQLVGSHRYTAGQLFRRWVRRHRAAVVVAVIAVVVLAGVGALGLRRIFREQRLAEEQRALAVARGADAEELMGFMLGDLREKLRPVGKLDLLDAVAKKAVEYYDKRADGESDLQAAQRASALQALGDVMLSRAEMGKALTAFRDSAALWERLAARDPTSAAWAFGLAASHGSIATTLISQGDAKGASAAYRRALTGLEAAIAREPQNLAWQLRLAMNHREHGDALAELGDGPAAVAEFRACVAIATAQGGKHPDDSRWQRTLAVCHSQLGGALLQQGDAAGALAECRADIAISERLAAEAPKDLSRQSDVAGAHSRVGDVLRATGDNKGALAEFRTALAVAARLAANDPANADWQHDAGISYDRVGNVLLELGQHEEALVQYRASKEIKQRLVERDPTNLVARRNLAVGHNKVGSVMEVRKDVKGALAEYTAGLVILEAITLQDPANAGWQRDLAVSYYLVADMLLADKEPENALARHQASVAIVEKLVALDPKNAMWQADVIDGHMQIGKTLGVLGRPTEALAAYQKARALAGVLAAKDPKNPSWTELIGKLDAAIKACCPAPKRR